MADSNESQNLAAAFAQAAAIAKDMPEKLQEIAFQRALDALLAPVAPAPRSSRAPEAQPKAVAPRVNPTKSRVAPARQNDGGRAERLIDVIDRTEGAQIVSTGRVLDKALLVLRAAHKHGIEVLTPGEIAKVLTDKFRERTSDAAVRMALGGDKTFTDRKRDGTGFAYRLMAPGERHLNALENGAISVSQPAPKRSPARKGGAAPKSIATPSPAKAVPTSASAAPSDRTSTRASSSGRPGPKAVLETLIDQRYFDESRAVGDVIAHLQEKKGHRYKATDLSPALARLLREEKLDRDRDANGQYRYVRKS